MKPQKKKVLILWNQHESDIYETFQEQGPQPLDWDPTRTASEVGTVKEEMEAFINAVKEGPYEVHCVNVEDDFERLLAALRLHQPDVVFNLVEYFYENEALEAAVTGLYELFDVVYTGNEAHTLATCARKVLTKVLLDDAGIPTASYFVCEDRNIPDPIELEMNYPLIVKPALEDASGGIETSSVVRDYESLVARCEYILTEFEQPALVESYIDGREIHAAILGNENPRVLPLFEMEFDDSEFNPEGEWSPQIISYSAKWDPHSKSFYTMDAVCPPQDLDPELEERIKQVALSAYRLLGCRDYARVDMRIAEDGTPTVLEVNPNPDLSDDSAYVMCAKAAGFTYAQTLQTIIEMALRRRYVPDASATGDAPLPTTDLMERRYRQKEKRKCVHCGSPLNRASTNDPEAYPEPTPTPPPDDLDGEPDEAPAADEKPAPDAE